MRKQKKLLISALSFTTFFSALSITAGQDKAVAPATAEKKAEWSAEQLEVIKVSEAFDKAFNAGDVEAIAATLADDVRVVDEFGDVYEGKAAVKDLYAASFSAQTGSTLKTSVESVRIVASGVAVEEGVSYSTPAKGDTTSTTYQAVYVKKDGGWKLTQLHDYSIPAAKDSGVHSEYLTVLDWLAGDWVADTPNGVISIQAQWVDEGNAIELSFSQGQSKKQAARVRIGYDPSKKRIKSWTFDNAGGHGESSWSKVADQDAWLLKNEAVMPDGKVVTASQLLSIDPSGDKFTWATFDRAVDGVMTPSREEIVLTRKAPAPKPAREAAAAPAEK
jgi:uncharacterized protein (TIGR02246 family)